MVFEVDKTTEALIQKLDEGIKNVIDGVLEELKTEQKATRAAVAGLGQVCTIAADQTKELMDEADAASKTLRKLATADQLTEQSGKIHALLEERLTVVEDLRTALPELQGEVKEASLAMQRAQELTAEELKALLVEYAAAEARARAEQLDAALTRFEQVSASLMEKMDRLSAEAGAAQMAAEANQSTLNAIAAYLSMPGIKRLFKGMEEIKYESAQ